MSNFLRRYHFRWLTVLIVTLVGSSLLPRLGSITAMELLFTVVPVVLILGACWCIQAYFLVSYKGPLDARQRAFVSITLAVVLGTIFSHLEAKYVPAQYMPPGTILTFRFVDFVQRAVISFFLAMISYISLNIVVTTNLLQKTQLENERLKQADLHARLTSLQQQISPHFLFNSLSTLKTIAQDAETKHFIIQLSHVYRYLLSFNNIHLASVGQEIKFIESYLYILHERFQDALTVRIDVPEAYFEYQIPPLSLQLLFENAIKHNAFSEEQPLLIAVSVTDEHHLKVSNTLRPKNLPEPGTKLGLKNINDRFTLLLNQQIRVETDTTSFSVILPIVKDERSNH